MVILYQVMLKQLISLKYQPSLRLKFILNNYRGVKSD